VTNPAWVKGTSGNPSGRRNEKILTDALFVAVKGDPGRARRIAEKLLNMAEEGSLAAIGMVFERLDGKVPTIIDADINTTVTIDQRERYARLLELQAKAEIEEAETADNPKTSG
jgi:hypothetical protein